MAVIRKDFRFKVIKNFFTPDELKLLQQYCLDAIEEPNQIANTKDQEHYCPVFYDDKLMNTVLNYKRKIVEKASGLKLFKTYSYWRYYGFGSELENHIDRPACEISVTACINKTDNWPLIIKGKKVELDIGDALLYLGVEDTHSRPDIFRGDGMAQVFLHYVDANGPFAHHIDDNFSNLTRRKHSEEDLDYIVNVLKIKDYPNVK
jgi:hypothetical protein